MSPRFLAESTSTRLSTGVLLVAALLIATLLAATPSTASAQDVPTDGVPFSSVVDGSAYLGNGFRVWHHTRGYGEETSETALGGRLATPTAGGLAFMDGQFRVGNADTDFSVNLGGGFRWRNDDFFFDSPRIFGFSFWYDGEDTQLDNYFNQLGVSFERLGPLVDLRLNANIPLEDLKEGDDVMFTGDTVFSGNNLSRGTLVDADASLRVVDFEIAPRLFNLNAWGYGGGYQMDGNDVSEMGYKVGVRGYVYNDLAVDVGVTDDDLFGTNTVVQLIWTPGRVAPGITNWQHNIDDRMREQVYRNQYVAVTRTQVAGAVALTDVFGEDIRVVHVDSDAAPGGDGSFENPLNNLDDIDDNSEEGDIVLAHAQSTFTGQSATLQDAQRFLGEGLSNDGVTPQVHTVVTSELGQINLPETFAGASSAARPIIQNASAPAAVVLMGGNDEVNTLAEIEVSNFTITGGTRGVFSPTGVGDVNINELRVSNTAQDGIELTPLVETLANNSTQTRFTPTIDDVIFDNIGGDDIDLNGETTEPSTTTVVETIAISDVESTNGDGVGIRLTNHRRAATISNFEWNGGTTGEGALRIENDLAAAFNPAQATVAMSGTNTITGGIQNTAGEGYAIRLEGGSATHTIGGTTITNTGGDSIIASGGTANMNFTGRIEQTANAGASILSVENGHDGNLTFTELTASAGVIRATVGDGLQFDNADGVYTFNDNVDIEGVAGGGATSAINVTSVGGDSTGVITLTDATFDNVNGDTITFDGGTANMTLTGRITQTLNAQSVLSVTGGHDGTLAFTEITAGQNVIRAETGDGLQFENADGAYTFNSGVELVGTTEGISITADGADGSSGTFAFTDADNHIDNPTTGHAIEILGSDAIFSFAGEIDTNAATSRPFLFQNNTGGSATISADVNGAGSQGIWIENNTDGDVTFSGPVTLSTAGQHAILIENNDDGEILFSGQTTITTTSGNGVFVQNNVDGSTRFNNLDITTTTGAGFNASNNPTPYEIVVAGAGNMITTTTGTGLNLNNVNVGAANINFASVTVNGATNGVVLNNVTGGSVNIGAQGAADGDGGTMTTTGAAVVITNAANTTVANVIMNGGGVDYDVTTAAASTLTLTNNDINSAANNAVDVNMGAAGTSSTVTLTNNEIVTTSGIGVNAANAAANANLRLTGSGNTVATTAAGSRGLDLNNVNISGAGLTFSSVSTSNAVNGVRLNTTTGAAITINGGTIANSTGNGVDVTNATSLSMNNMTITGTAAGFDGIEIDHTGAATSAVTINGVAIDGGASGIQYNRNASATSRLIVGATTISNTDAAGIDIDINGTSDANVTINNGASVTNSNNVQAMTFNTTGGSNKTVRVLVDGSTFNSNSGATNTVDFGFAGTGTYNANVTGNTFANAGGAGGRAFEMTSDSAGSNVRLNLDGNNASSAHPTGDYLLDENAGDFDVVDRDDVDTNNTGDVEFLPTINDFGDIPGPVPLPQ